MRIKAKDLLLGDIVRLDNQGGYFEVANPFLNTHSTSGRTRIVAFTDGDILECSHDYEINLVFREWSDADKLRRHTEKILEYVVGCQLALGSIFDIFPGERRTDPLVSLVTVARLAKLKELLDEYFSEGNFPIKTSEP